MRGGSSKRGGWTTTRCVRTAAWGIGPQRSSRPKSAGKRAVEKPLRGKVQTTFPLRLEIPQTRRDSHFPTAPATTVYFPASPRGLKTKPGVLHYDWTKNRGQVISTHLPRGIDLGLEKGTFRFDLSFKKRFGTISEQ